MNLHKYQLYLLEQHSQPLTLRVNPWLWNWAPNRQAYVSQHGSSKAGIEGKLVILFLEMNMYVYVALLELFAMLYTVLKYAYK